MTIETKVLITYLISVGCLVFINMHLFFQYMKMYKSFVGLSNFLALVRGKFPIEVASVERDLADQIKKDENGSNEKVNA